MKQRAHYCTARCVCPVHATPLVYWPAGDDHACQDAGCEYEHGFKEIEVPDPRQALLDTQAILMWRYHPDVQNLGRTQ